MTRLIHIWLVLFVTNLFAAATIGILAFEVVDLRFEAFAQVILVPWVQACAAWLLLGESRAVSLLGALRETVTRQPALAIFLVADAIVLAVSFEWDAATSESVARDWRMATIYVGLKAIIAGCLILGSLIRHRHWSRGQCAWAVTLGFGLLAYGSTCFFNWLRLLPDVAFQNLPVLFRWLAFYGPIFVASIWVLLKVEATWRKEAPVAARMLELVPALSLVSATVVVLGLFNNPQVAPFWEQVARSFSLLAVSALWSAVWQFRQGA